MSCVINLLLVMQGMISPKFVNLTGQTCQICTEVRPGSRQMPQIMKMDAKKLHGTSCQPLLAAARWKQPGAAAEPGDAHGRR